MKKLSFFLFAILILGCTTETPVIEEHTPTVASAERFRFSGGEPQLVLGTVWDGENNVDPVPINAGGFLFGFDGPLKLYKIAIFHDGKNLDWHPLDITHNGTESVRLTPIAGQELQFDTEYVIKMYVQDIGCQSSRFEIQFWTMPEP